MIGHMFIAGEGLLYRIDPRTKTLALLLFCLLLFLPLSPLGHLLLLLATLALALRAVGIRYAFKPLRLLSPLLLMMLFFVPFTHRSAPPLLTVKGFLLVTTTSLEKFVHLALRLVTLSYLFTLYFWTTPMGQILVTLRWYGLPYNGCLILTLAFRFIPFIAESFGLIRDSQALRNANLDQRSGRKDVLSRLVPTVTAAIVFALRAIPNLAMSLEHRGLGRSAKRSSLQALPKGSHLFTQFLICIMITIGCWLLFCL